MNKLKLPKQTLQPPCLAQPARGCVCSLLARLAPNKPADLFLSGSGAVSRCLEAEEVTGSFAVGLEAFLLAGAGATRVPVSRRR